MIDWLTLRCDVPDYLHDEVRNYRDTRPQVMKWTPSTCQIEWQSFLRESIRSDSHQITVYVGGQFEICGSPARSMGLETNVFGSNDLLECAKAHISAAQKCLPFKLPALEHWRITRVDITQNYDLGSLTHVKQALAYLRQTDAGRYKLRTSAETCYWSAGSSMRSGKAYAKGPHLRRQVARGEATATHEEMDKADKLLRLELRLGGEFFRRYRQQGGDQWNIKLNELYTNYFSALVGAVEVTEMNDLQRIQQASPTPGQGLAAHRTWLIIQAVGHQNAREGIPKTTWYRHLEILKKAGFSWADIAAGNVVPFRRRALVLERPINSWAEIAA